MTQVAKVNGLAAGARQKSLHKKQKVFSAHSGGQTVWLTAKLYNILKMADQDLQAI